MASASALRQLASAKLAYFKIMCLDPLVNNGSSKTGCTVRIIPCQQSSRTRCKWCECARASLLALPAEEYDWFDIHARTFRSIVDGTTVTNSHSLSHEVNGAVLGVAEPALSENRQRQFFEFPGPLFSVTVSPASTMVRVGEAKELRALPRDRSRRRVEHDLTF
jgi:hypothetical protein